MAEAVELGDGPLHHVMFAGGMAARRNGQVVVPSHWNGNLRAYGELIPGSVAVLPEDENLSAEVAVPLDASLTPVLLPGFSSRGLLSRSLAYHRARPLIRNLVRRAAFVQLQYKSSFSFLAGLAAVDYGKHLYLDMGGTMLEPAGAHTNVRTLRSHLARIYYRRAEKKLVRAADLIIAVSAHLHDTIPSTDVPKAVISHSMIEGESIYRRDTACTGDTLTIFLATRMIESKGIHHLLRVVKRLRAEGAALRLKVAGVGDYLQELRRLSVQLGLEEHVTFLGGIKGGGEELWSYFRRADLVVLPSLGHYEGTPRMILEAWAAGAPVVATTVGGIPALVTDRKDGLLVPPADEEALARAIREVYTDARLRAELVANAYQHIETMTYESRLPLLREIFQRYLPGLLPRG